MASSPRSDHQQEASDIQQAARIHQRWLKSVLGLGALEAKLWVASSAQLLALMCGVVFLILTTWLPIITPGAAVAWSYGFSLVGIFITSTLRTFISAVVLLYLVKRTLHGMNFTRTLDAIIPTDEE